MDRRTPYTARPRQERPVLAGKTSGPAAGSFAPVLVSWMVLIGRYGLGFGKIWVWVGHVGWWIQTRYWKENHGGGLKCYTTRSAARWPRRITIHHILFELLRTHSTSIIWIAACVYFAWSPDLACAGLLVVCGVVGWITIFIHAPYVRASVVTWREYEGAAWACMAL
ncbi:hypothetical protein B0H14DRAFT_2652693 [Mycena olivaceomarginata]|nr:hypothetical protein B0H14DRAFT_2652693 [Mycena olivaceomarginata]